MHPTNEITENLQRTWNKGGTWIILHGFPSKLKLKKKSLLLLNNSLERLEHNECHRPRANKLISIPFCKVIIALTLTDIRFAVSLIMSSAASILTVWSYWFFTGRTLLKNTGTMKFNTHYRNLIELILSYQKKKKIWGKNQWLSFIKQGKQDIDIWYAIHFVR